MLPLALPGHHRTPWARAVARTDEVTERLLNLAGAEFGATNSSFVRGAKLRL